MSWAEVFPAAVRARPAARRSGSSAAGYLPPENKSYLQDITKKPGFRPGARRELPIMERWTGKAKSPSCRASACYRCPWTVRGSQKGLYLLEAMAAGVPVVQPRRGSFPEVVEATGGGILVDDGDLDGLAAGIASLWENPERRRQLGAAGFDAVRAHYGIPQMLAEVMGVYRRLAGTD